MKCCVICFVIVFKVVLTLKSVDETLLCDHNGEVLSGGTVYALQ